MQSHGDMKIESKRLSLEREGMKKFGLNPGASGPLPGHF